MAEKKKVGILSYGVVRGLIGQVIGTIIGLAFISLLRLILGMGWNPEPSWVFAMVVGFFGFLIGRLSSSCQTISVESNGRCFVAHAVASNERTNIEISFSSCPPKIQRSCR